MARKKTPKMKKINIANADIRVCELPVELINEVAEVDNSEFFGITIDGEFLRTPHGNLIFHKNERAMRELLSEIDYSDELDVSRISLFNLCCTQIEFIQENRQKLSIELTAHQICSDPVLNPCSGPEFIDQYKYLKIVIDFLMKNGVGYPSLPDTYRNSGQLPNKNGIVENSYEQNFRRIVSFYFELIKRLNDFELTVFITVVHVFHSPTLGLMLARREITPNEFSVAYYASQALDSKTWGDTDRKEEQEFLLQCKKDAECMVRYIEQFSPKLPETERLIQIGETTLVEFKSTLRWDIKEDRKNSEITHEILKTLAAFLNSDGGTLFVGVSNEKKALGIELDRFEDEDKYLLYFSTLVNDHIGRQFTGLIFYELEPAQGKTILKVICQKSTVPIILKNNGKEEFFIRSGPSSIQLTTPSQIVEYSKTRFHSQ